MKIYNTLTRKKEEFKPIKNGEVLMYHCGPTVYWTQHIGNLRAMVLADLVVRTLKYLGYQVKLVRNYTDVGHLTSDSDQGEDKMEKASKRENLNPLKIAEKYIQIFEHDIHALNIADPDVKPRATECVQDMIKTVQILLDKGYAYVTDLSIYFDVSKAKDYNRLSKQNLAEQIKNAGKAEVSDPQKKHPTDFALWFFKAGTHKNALQTWPSPFSSPLVENGEGFPGWHIECSTMANKFLSPTIDIHMGGVEHIPIHHTNEIAQSEAANGVKFVNYWLHNEHLLVDNGKMSKSQGTGYSLQEIIDKGFNPLSLRYFFLQAHYRSKQNFTWQALESSQIALNKLYDFFRYPNNDVQNSTNKIHNGEKFKNKFIKYISDDFNIPQALALVWEIIKSDELNYQTKKELVLDFDQVFGLKLNQIKPAKNETPQEVQTLIKQREKARENKNWSLADQLRDKILALGFSVEDTTNKSVIKKIKK